MRILLIEPDKTPVVIGSEDFSIYEPLALEYVAAGVSKVHEVKILDLRIENTLKDTLQKFSPDVVGITSYTVQVNIVLSLFKQIKLLNPKILTVVGGHHATIMPEDFISDDIDVIVIGEGIFTFRELVSRYEKGIEFEGITGIAVSGNGSLKKSGLVGQVDLDAFPFPERQLTKKYREHYYSYWMKPLASIRTSKGCPYRCNFCAMWKLTNGKYFKRTPQKIVEELEGIEEKYVFFADDESLLDVPRMMKLAELIKEKGIQKRYFLYGRSDTISRNPELIRLWREIGLERVFVGLEFFRDEDLKYILKRSTVDDNNKAVKILQELDIDIYASFIVRPEFTKNDFAELRSYIQKLKLDFAAFTVLTPLPGTDLFNEVESKLITRNYDFFDFIHTVLPTKLPLKEFYKEYLHLYKKGITLWRSILTLRKYPRKEILSLIKKSLHTYKRFEKAYLDYKVKENKPNIFINTR
ncbi:MAG: radical SAM protein [Ignavibacteriaceae bacterium]